MTQITKMQQKRGTAAEWAELNLVLADGEIGFERDTGVIKIGNGFTPWNYLKPHLRSVIAPTEAQLTTANPVLEAGEIVIARDAMQFKIGDGVKRWNELPYALVSNEIKSAVALALADDNTLVTAVQQAVTSQLDSQIELINEQVEQGLSNNPSVVNAAELAVADRLAAEDLVRDFEADQPDYVAMLAQLSPYSTMRVTKRTANNELEILITSPNGLDRARHMVTDSLNFQKFSSVESNVGPVVAEQVTTSKFYGELTRTGTFTTTSVLYTTQTGATFTAEVITTTPNALVDLTTYRDNRGGLWKIDLVENTAVTATVSVYSATVVNEGKHSGVIIIPTAGKWTVRGTYMGADPANAPSGGTARGWLRSNTSTAIILEIREVNVRSRVFISPPTSNKEMAWAVRKNGDTAYSVDWVPTHGTDSEDFVTPNVYIFDGEIVDVASWPIGTSRVAKTFDIIQNIYGKNPADPNNTTLMSIWTTTRWRDNGVVTFRGRAKILVDTQVNSAYSMMLTGEQAVFNRLISSLGTAMTFAQTNTQVDIPVADGDRAQSYVLLSSTHPTAVAAVTFTPRTETLRVNDPAKVADTNDKMFLQQRSGGVITKLYPRVFGMAQVLPAGLTYRWGGSYFYGGVASASNLLDL